MTLPYRPISRIVRAPFEPQHYYALLNMVRVYENPLHTIARYFFGHGQLPVQLGIRTPLGIVRPWIYHAQDLLTANLIFCREDYRAEASIRTVLDIGSNIGLSGLYFLSRNDLCRCYLFEPVPQNVARLIRNLHGFESRYVLREAAVAETSGVVDFRIEPTGIYGRIFDGVSGPTIKVQCVSVNDVIENILSCTDHIDLFKVDTEGWEFRIIESIAPEFMRRIQTIYLEGWPTSKIFPEIYEQTQRGSVCRLSVKR
jgi:FkbM family methyltransferase